MANCLALSNDEAQQYMYSVERQTSPSCIRDTHFKKFPFYGDAAERELIIIHGLRAALAHCAQHHLFILNVAKKVENFFAPVCFVKNLQITIQLCLLGFVMIKVSQLANFMLMVNIFKKISFQSQLIRIMLSFGS